jgi:hypothetical protein
LPIVDYKSSNGEEDCSDSQKLRQRNFRKRPEEKGGILKRSLGMAFPQHPHPSAPGIPRNRITEYQVEKLVHRVYYHQIQDSTITILQKGHFNETTDKEVRGRFCGNRNVWALHDLVGGPAAEG